MTVEHHCPHCGKAWIGTIDTDSACLACREAEERDPDVLARHIATERSLLQLHMREVDREIVDLLSPAYARVRAAWRRAVTS